MTYADSSIWWGEIHKKDKRTGIIVSLSIHALLFFIGGAIFVKTAQYSIQSVPESTQVDLVEAPPEPKVEEDSFAQAPPEPKKEVEEVKPQPKVVHVQSVVKTEAKPDYFQNPPPVYPDLAKQMRQEGIVMLSVNVNREGIPVRVEILESSGHRILDEAALKAVSRWKFQPGRIGDLPVESKVTVPIRFRLEVETK